jgi:hypothetical protein
MSANCARFRCEARNEGLELEDPLRAAIAVSSDETQLVTFFFHHTTSLRVSTK